MIPEPGRSWRAEFTPGPEAPAQARHDIRALAALWGVPPETAELAELVVSELVTNSVQHAARNAPSPPSADATPYVIVLALRYTDDVLRIEVTDWDATPPRTPSPLAPSDAEGEHGRGLVIVAAVSKQWGCLHPVGGGKTVWSEVS